MDELAGWTRRLGRRRLAGQWLTGLPVTVQKAGRAAPDRAAGPGRRRPGRGLAADGREAGVGWPTGTDGPLACLALHRRQTIPEAACQRPSGGLVVRDAGRWLPSAGCAELRGAAA